jgi:NAD(P) transhydrogenase subunit alpha
MKIGVAKEARPHERRVAATPASVRKYVELGYAVAVEQGAGLGAFIADDAYAAAGAAIARDFAALAAEADVLLRVRPPLTQAEGGPDEIRPLKEGAVLIGLLQPRDYPAHLALYAGRRVTAFALDHIPRISRAQAMDGLTSQSNLAGYKAVLEAAHEFPRAFPMMMTAGGTIAPARVLVLGAGVAGLQAIATARRLGAVASAFDVRAAVKEEVESLGGSFIEVPPMEEMIKETDGYAREMSDAYRRHQLRLIAAALKANDIVICSALIPGRRAPVLVTAEMVGALKPGSVIVDLAAASGGNCELSRIGETVDAGGVRIIAPHNLPSLLPIDASNLYARNVLNLVAWLTDKAAKAVKIDWDDEIVRGMLLARDGHIVHPQFKGAA